MRIYLTSVFVDDQDKALRFYTQVLGFQKKTEVPVGEYRWLTVVSPEALEGPELVLEPEGHPAVGPFKAALVQDGIPFTSFAVVDVDAEYERLRDQHGLSFTGKPHVVHRDSSGELWMTFTRDPDDHWIGLMQQRDGYAAA